MNTKQHISAYITRIWNLLVLASFCSSVGAYAQTADSFDPGASGSVSAIAIQVDGRILVGGNFTNLAGMSRSRFGRLESDGTIDNSFDPVNGGSSVEAILVQPDGKIVIGGAFTNLGGQICTNIGRINSDGTIDPSFKARANNPVFSVLLQADGKIIVQGAFTLLNGITRNFIGRLNSDGSLDSGFNAGSVTDLFNIPQIESVALQSDGKILIGGMFTHVGGQPCVTPGRLNTNGTVDTNFVATRTPHILCLTVQADEKILMGGDFSILDGGVYKNMRRVFSGGSSDAVFQPDPFDGAAPIVFSSTLQANRKIYVAGRFATLAGINCNSLGRLNHDGTFDVSFNSENYYDVKALAIQSDGKVLAGGTFGRLGGQTRKNIARLNNNEVASETISVDSEKIAWIREGAGPEFLRTTFDGSADATNWFFLGAGERTLGGWQLVGTAFSTNLFIRARGFIQQKNSGWCVESFYGPLTITTQPLSLTNNPNSRVTFYIGAIGSSTLTYQWYKNGQLLGNGNNISGANTSLLVLTNVLGTNAGQYSVTVSDSSLTVTSRVVSLTVIDPNIVNQPTNRTAILGQALTAFSVTPNGTSPFSYQWRKDGTNIASATTNSLALTNIQSSDAAAYDVIVANSFGSVTSAIAFLYVNLSFPDPLNLNANNNVYPMVMQPDGKILLGGDFTMLGGQTRNRLARLNADGSLDTNFNPNANGVVFSLVTQSDGKIIAGGGFTTLAGQTWNRIARLNADGVTDTNFNSSANNLVTCLAPQSDGKVVVGGFFTSLSGQARNYLGRLNGDGNLDTNFNPTVNLLVYSVALQPDGKILLGGNFTTLGGQPHAYVGRFNSNGTVDTNFNATANNTVRCVALQSDGKVLLGGAFTILGGQTRNCIGRLNADGTLDTNFNASANNTVHSLALQTDGRILVSGDFTNLNGQARNFIGRLNSDGTVDNTFFSGANTNVYSVTVQPDGKILVGGAFTNYNGQTRNFFARLFNTDPAIANLALTNATVTWLRAGASPEIWRTIFESSSDGTNWITLGDGLRTNGTWQLTGVDLATATSIRARGFVASGRFGGSAWFDENIIQFIPPSPLKIVIDDGSFGFISNQFGFNIGGNSGQVIVLEVSTNFSNWISISTNILGGEPIYFSDPDVLNFPQRFYRARVP